MDDQRRNLGSVPVLTPREALTAAMVFLAMLIQILVPSLVLESGPSEEAGNDDYLYRYGWQMFTESEQDVRYEAVLAHGTREGVAPTLVLGSFWGNVHYGNAALGRLCRVIPEATMIVRHISPRSGDDSSIERYRCR